MGTSPSYPPRIAELLTEERLSALGPGTPNERVRAALQTLTPRTAFAPEAVRDEDMARACLAGLWLYHDFLDESHRISQEIETPTGSYWHGLMHRREGDFGNSKYWFRRVGRHPVFEPLRDEAAKLAAASPVGIVIPASWDPFWFVDLCEECATGQGERAMPVTQMMLARQIQKREWELLFQYCREQAVGG
jgi:hypothetical protein